MVEGVGGSIISHWAYGRSIDVALRDPQLSVDYRPT